MRVELHPSLIIEDQFDKLLDRMPAKLADVVRKKYEKDYEDFIAAAAEVQKSKNPVDWADGSCRKCLGRGITGTRYRTTDFKNEVPTDEQCRCTIKRYKKWLHSFRLEFTKKRETENGKTT